MTGHCSGTTAVHGAQGMSTRRRMEADECVCVEYDNEKKICS